MVHMLLWIQSSTNLSRLKSITFSTTLETHLHCPIDPITRFKGQTCIRVAFETADKSIREIRSLKSRTLSFKSPSSIPRYNHLTVIWSFKLSVWEHLSRRNFMKFVAVLARNCFCSHRSGRFFITSGKQSSTKSLLLVELATAQISTTLSRVILPFKNSKHHPMTRSEPRLFANR